MSIDVDILIFLYKFKRYEKSPKVYQYKSIFISLDCPKNSIRPKSNQKSLFFKQLPCHHVLNNY